VLVNAALGTRALRGLLLSVPLLTASIFMGAPAADAASPAPVTLGTADPFAILAGTPNITNVPPSVITGNVGLSPASAATSTVACSDLTGTSKFYTVTAAGGLAGPPCQVVDPVLLTGAKNDLTNAFTDVMNRVVTNTVPTELGGHTYPPGVYDSLSTTFGITAGAGPLILDGQGNPNAVFIFEMNSGSTGLTVGPGSQVQLTGGAQACNVFWRVTTASIDTTAVFKGTILALTSITVNQGANIEGRLLARNGTVTLIQDTITRSVCSTPVPPAPPVLAPPRFTG
jgi:ice-binding like protein